MSHGSTVKSVAAKLKLTDEQVKRIRRRVRAGELVIDPADEFDVDRKTIWRRLGDLERAETERTQRKHGYLIHSMSGSIPPRPVRSRTV